MDKNQKKVLVEFVKNVRKNNAQKAMENLKTVIKQKDLKRKNSIEIINN